MLKKINRNLVAKLDKIFYPNYSNNWDDWMLRDLILKYIKSTDRILDVGAGRGILESMNFKGKVQEVIGVDPVEEVKQNPYLDKGFVGLGDSMPFFEDEQFDLVFSDNVLEHIESPDTFYQEVGRVLKKGGYFIAKTPNKYHYMPLFASLTPTSFHKFYNKLKGRSAEDTFPTRYRANTKKDQKRHGAKYELKLIDFFSVEGRPEYLRVTFLTYPAGIFYGFLVNKLGLDNFKIVSFSVMQKV
ncbi:MAG: class I SAM-dependent methyltransferase [Bacteroidota bacterium]